jgi:D-sedoheptulose 7-phosphate isomerase
MAMPTISGVEAMVEENIASSVAMKQAMLRDAALLRGIAEAGKRIAAALRAGRRLLLIGNGGSAADAQHIAAEFVGRYRRERRALPAMALTVNTSALTAIGNDYGFENLFARQVEAFAQPGDVLLGMSTSGKSRNVIQAMHFATAMQVKTIALTGRSGGELQASVELCLCMPSEDTPRIQEAHMLTGHAISEIVEWELYGGLE